MRVWSAIILLIGALGCGQGKSGSTSTAPSRTISPAASISSVIVSNITAGGALISWATNTPATSQVNFGTTTAYGSSTPVDTQLVTSHTMVVSGLSASTTYHFKAHSQTANNTSLDSNDMSFTTGTPGPTPTQTPVTIPTTTTSNSTPVLYAIGVTSITSSQATINWSTDIAADSQVDYGMSVNYGSSTVLNSTLTTTHSQVISGLLPSTIYHFRVRSGGAVSTDFIFATGALTNSGNPPPAPTIFNVSTGQISTTSATITWATDIASDSQVEFGTTTSYGTSTTLDPTSTTSHLEVLSGLADSTVYHFRVHSGAAVSSDYTFTTASASKTTVYVFNVTASSVSSTSEAITWTTSEAGTSQVSYGLTSSYGLSTVQDMNYVTQHSVTLTNLTPGTTYHYIARSVLGNLNEYDSADLTFTTASPPTSGPVISSVTASPTPSSSYISWTTDVPSDSSVSYGTTSAYGSSTATVSTLVTSHGATLIGLSPSTTYHYKVTSKSASGLASSSPDMTFTTLPAAAPGLPKTVGWSELPNTSMQFGAPDGSSVCPPDNYGGDSFLFHARCYGVVAAWNSAVSDTIRDRLILWGGGHNDYYGNELYAVNLHASPSPTMTRLNNPTVPTNCGASSGCPNSSVGPAPEELPAFQIRSLSRSANVVTLVTTVPHNFAVGTQVQLLKTSDSTFDGYFNVTAVPNSYTIQYAQTGIDTTLAVASVATVSEFSGTTGAPNQRHTYSGQEFMPNVDKFFAYGGSLAGFGNASGRVWTLDNLGAMTGTYATNPNAFWTSHTPACTNGICPRGYLAVSPSYGMISTYDSLTGHIFMYDGPSIFEYDPINDTWTRRASNLTINVNLSGTVIDVTQRLFLIIGGGSTFGVKAIYIGAGSNYAVQNWTYAGCETLVNAQAPGLAYDPIGKQIVGVIEGGLSTYYLINADPVNQKITCQAVTPSYGPPATVTKSHGVYGRFRYFADDDLFVYYLDYSLNAWILRLRPGQ